MSHNQERGYLGEQEFIKRLNQEGIPYTYIDDWCDFEIYGQPVEVKTTRLTHKFTDKKRKSQPYKIGRFQFTEEQREKRIYTAFFVRQREEFLFLGIGIVPKQSRKYISIHKTRDLNLMTLKDFIKKIKRKIK